MATSADIRMEIVHGPRLTSAQRAAIKALCDEAYAMDYAPFLDSFTAPTHVLAWQQDRLLSHALWITRWLRLEPDGPDLRTAYVEAVATALDARRRGLAAQVMRRLAKAVQAQAYDIAALSPSDRAYYARLGWELWQGPLFIRTEQGLVPTPKVDDEDGEADEEVMILRLPNTPPLDIQLALSIEWRPLEVW